MELRVARLHPMRGYEDENVLVLSVDVAKSFNFIFPHLNEIYFKI